MSSSAIEFAASAASSIGQTALSAAATASESSVTRAAAARAALAVSSTSTAGAMAAMAAAVNATATATTALSANLNCEDQLNLFRMKNISVFTLHNMSDDCKPLLSSRYDIPAKVFIGLFLSILASGTCFGNVLVIMAVGLVKKLQNPSNLLIVSLASSDLLVSVLVLPIAIMTQLLGYFPFGEVVCDFFISCDVLLCSSSILNLCAISIDRYLVITKPFEYAVKRTPTRMGLMIAAVWLLSAFISIPPMFGWKEQFVPGYCGYPELLGYQIYATFGAFYLPLIIMLVLYGNIFKLARKMAKADEKQKVVHIKQEDKNLIDEQLPNGQTARPSMQSSASDLPKRSVRQPASRKKNNSDSKAIKTLGVIMGCFTLCWLPFFIIQIVVPIYNVVQGEKLDMNPNVFEFFLWLGESIFL
ncbi:hypothetical protein BOX15_Mlig005906g2, partial [Macrostomum lignano]